jgi:ribosome maturation factor RimP
MSSQPEQLLRPVVVAVVERLGYDLEGLTVSAAGRRHVLKVVVDRDGGFGLDDVAILSRELSTVLEQDDDLIPGSYVLEVSSPGVDRPLTEPRHWRRNLNRLVNVTMVGGAQVAGRIRSTDDVAAVLADDTTGDEQTIAYADVERALVQIELRPKRDLAGAGATDEPDGLDDLDDLDDHEG